MKTKIYLLIFSLLIINLEAGIEQYFKRGFDKSGYHSMQNIDFIYMINLDKRPEKFLRSSEKLAPYGIYPCRFPAVNGWELTIEAINDLGIKYDSTMAKGIWGTYYPMDGGPVQHEIMHEVGRTYFCHCMPRGSIGIVLSHLSVLQDAYDSNYQTIWVMEDDVEVVRDPTVIPHLIEKLDALVGPSGWDILFTDMDTKSNNGYSVPCSSYALRPNFTPLNPERFAEKKQISKDFRKIGSRYGAYSMIVRRSGMKKILKFIKKHHVFLPYDMEFTLPNDIKLFTVLSDVVSTQINALSDNGAPNYQDKKAD